MLLSRASTGHRTSGTADARSRKRHPIESVPPGAERSVAIAGVVREVQWHVDVYASLKLPRTAVTEGLLGALGSGAWAGSRSTCSKT